MKQSPLRKIGTLVGLLILVFLSFSVSMYFSSATPDGAQITYNNTVSVSSNSPDNRSDDGGTITTMILDTVQQVGSWKGYIGNVTGKFTLDDADGYTLYDWDFVGVSLSGEIYAARASSITWANIACANIGNITAEETFHNMTGTDTDSINNTFNYTIHDQFTVGSATGPSTIVNDTCRSTATYVNDTRQSMANKTVTYFQEVILQDTDDNIVFTTIMEDDYDSYKTIASHTYDFQMIVPESDIKVNPTTYYFFLELT
jgi:hypothetical protein